MAIAASELRSLKDRVYSILCDKKITRCNDDLLYYEVCSEIAAEQGVTLNGISFYEMMHRSRVMGFPIYESVRRARQKVQAENPELKENLQDRLESEKSFRAFARDNDGKA